jgi:hypothetical protein
VQSLGAATEMAQGDFVFVVFLLMSVTFYIVAQARFCFCSVIVSRIPSTNKTRGVHCCRCASQLKRYCDAQIDSCDGLKEMPSLIDCVSLRSLTIAHNFNLSSISDASLHTCTSLVELIIRRNGDRYKAKCVDRLPPTTFPNLTTLQASLHFKKFVLR